MAGRKSRRGARAVAPNHTAVSGGGGGGAVTYGWELTTSNTGLAGAGLTRGSLPLWNGTGSGTLSNGLTISQKHITTSIFAQSFSNVTIDRCWIQPDDGRGVIPGPGFVIKDSDIDHSLVPPSPGERFGFSSEPGIGTMGDYTIQRCLIENVTIGIYLDSNSSAGIGLVEDTLITNLHVSVPNVGDEHLDGIRRSFGNAPLTINRCRSEVSYSDSNGTHATGALFLQNLYGGSVGGIQVNDSLFYGNGFCMVIAPANGPLAAGFNNCRTFSTEYGDIDREPGTLSITQWAIMYRYNAAAPPLCQGAALTQPT